MTAAYKMELHGVTKVFKVPGKPDVPALGPIDMQVPAHRFVTIVGPSGCGKSTLFNIISGLTEPTVGTVYIDGKPVQNSAGMVAYMLQKDLLLPWRTILDNVILSLELRRVPKQEAKARAVPLLHKYGLKGFENSYPSQLSGGMRQRAAFLRTLLYDSDIILLDEPFGALDAQTRSIMQEWLLSIWSEYRKTVIFVTHDIDEAIYLSDEVYLMSARPGTFRHRMTIDLPRPREPEVVTSARFVELKKEALDVLSEEVLKAARLQTVSN